MSSFLDRIRRKKSKDEVFQGKSRKEQSNKTVATNTTTTERRINIPVRCEVCNTDFSSPQDYERHIREDHPDIPPKH